MKKNLGKSKDKQHNFKVESHKGKTAINRNSSNKYDFPKMLENCKQGIISEVKNTDKLQMKTNIIKKRNNNLHPKKEKSHTKIREENKLNYKNNEINNNNKQKYNILNAINKDSSKNTPQYNNIKKSSKNIQQFNKNQIINNNNFKNHSDSNNMNNNIFNSPKKINKKNPSNNNKKNEIVCPHIDINKFQNNGINYNINNFNFQNNINNINIFQNNNINKEIINPNPNSIVEFSFGSYRYPPLVILDNHGKKITYMNTVLQCLANIRNITSEILKGYKSIEENQNKMPITFQYFRILYHLFNLDKKNEKYYNFQIFYQIILQINPIFKGKSTKNAIDFLVFLIDKLDEENKTILNHKTNNNILKEPEYQKFSDYLKYLKENKEKDSIIFRTFAWINKKYEKCWECNIENTIFQKFFTYDLNIENAINKSIINNKKILTIHDCIQYASENQILYNTYCKYCNKKNNKDVKSTIYMSQNVLILLLREIEKTKNIEDMINNDIQIQIENDIDLSDLVENENSYKHYTIHGLILYDLDKNEYFAYCVSPIDGNWYKYTDGDIQPVKNKNFIRQINYKILPVILFYRHIE